MQSMRPPESNQETSGLEPLSHTFAGPSRVDSTVAVCSVLPPELPFHATPVGVVSQPTCVSPILTRLVCPGLHILHRRWAGIGIGTPPRLALSPTLVRFAAYQAAAIRIADTNPASRASSTACGVCTGGGTRTHDQGHSTAISLLAVKLCRLSYPGIMPVFPGCPSVYSDCRVVRRHTLRRSFFLQGF